MRTSQYRKPARGVNGNWFAVSRAMIEHPIVGIHGRAFTDLEAWLWLLAEAAYKPRKITSVVLQPGELMHSRRFLATRWGWSEDKVRWFLKRLRSEKMLATIKTRNHTPQTQVLSICNYAQYQRVNNYHTQPTPRLHPKANKVTQKEEKEARAPARESARTPLNPPGWHGAGGLASRAMAELAETLRAKSE